VIATAKRRRKREKTLETAESNEAESSVDLQAAARFGTSLQRQMSGG